MKKNFYSIVSLFCLLFISQHSFSQELKPGFKFNGEATIVVSDKQFYDVDAITFEVYNDKVVIAYESGSRVEYKASSIIGFTHKATGKKFISVKNVLGGSPFFVEDLTTDNKKLKVIKYFIPDEPLVQKDSMVMGTWAHAILPIKADGERKLLGGYKKIAEYVKTDCPTLSQKISSKEKGYFLGLMAGSIEEEIEIYHRICKEFEGCK